MKDQMTQVNHELWKNIVHKNLEIYRSLSESQKKLIQYINDNELSRKVFNVNHNTSLVDNSPEYKNLIAKIYSENQRQQILDIKSINYLIEKRVLRQSYTEKNTKLYQFINELCKLTGKKENELRDVDFFNTPVQESMIDEDDLFSSKVELIFYNYAKRRDLNRKEWFYKNEDGEVNSGISDTEFTLKNLPPWDLINEILTRHSIDFYFKGIEKKDFSLEVPLDLQLHKKSTDEIIIFNDLSSGEKVIIGLILKLFTSEYYGDNLKFPELLILDEPDAHLHPEMSKLLLDVLRDTFVDKYGVKVIITTHSPSTIALADSDQIYRLSNGENTSLKKISKDEALEILTSFIPTLSIDYKNHRQIFVESPTDRFYYQTIYNRLNQDKLLTFTLYFISNGYGKGNSDSVAGVVSAIRKSDNKTCFGVIDWDKKNRNASYLKVHGEGMRYSIENYLYDPLYLITLFLENSAQNCHKELDVDLSFNQYDIGLNPSLAQKGVNWFFNKYYSKFNITEAEINNTRMVKYYNGLELELPIWYLEFKGHDLEIKLKQVFKSLEGYRNEGDLQKKLTLISAKSFPVIHLDTVNLIDDLLK